MVQLAGRLATPGPADDQPKRPPACPPDLRGDDDFIAEVEHFKQLLNDYSLDVRMGVVDGNRKKLELIRLFIERSTLAPLEGQAYIVFAIGGGVVMANGALKARDMTKPAHVAHFFSELVTGIMAGIETRFGGLPGAKE